MEKYTRLLEILFALEEKNLNYVYLHNDDEDEKSASLGFMIGQSCMSIQVDKDRFSINDVLDKEISSEEVAQIFFIIKNIYDDKQARLKNESWNILGIANG